MAKDKSRKGTENKNPPKKGAVTSPSSTAPVQTVNPNSKEFRDRTERSAPRGKKKPRSYHF